MHIVLVIVLVFFLVVVLGVWKLCDSLIPPRLFTSPLLGGSSQDYRVLVFGGPSSYIQPPFFTVGNHSGSSFGFKRNWQDNQFWLDLRQYLIENHLSFDAVMIDPGSDSWLHHIPWHTVYEMFITDGILKKNAVLIFEFSEAMSEYLMPLHEELLYSDEIHHVGTFRKKDVTGFFLVYSPSDTLQDTILGRHPTDIVTTNITYLDETPQGTLFKGKDSRNLKARFLIFMNSPTFYSRAVKNMVTEKKLVDFIENRILQDRS